MLRAAKDLKGLLIYGGGVDGLQFDKVPPDRLSHYVEEIRKYRSDILLLGAGGINEANVMEYAAAGIDAIVTTSMYFGRLLDFINNPVPLDIFGV